MNLLARAVTFNWKKKKDCGINLTKDEKDLYNENYKTLMRETEGQKNGQTSHSSWNGRINIKMFTLPKLSLRFSEILIKYK